MVKAETLEMLRRESAADDLDLSWIDEPAAERGLRVDRKSVV